MTSEIITLQEMVDNYRGCCDIWKVKMAASCIAEMGCPQRLWEEIMQDLMIRVCQYRHNNVANISEALALRTKIRNRIRDIMRQEKRRNNNTQKLKNIMIDDSYTVELLQLCGETPQDVLCLAVRAAVSRLDDYHQKICNLFMEGYCRSNVAKILKLTWRELRKEIASIKSSFLSMGIEEIIDWRGENRIAQP